MIELIAKLRACLAEVEHLKQLHYGNRKWELWRDKVLDLLDLHLGSESEEKLRFEKTRGPMVVPVGEVGRQQYYARRLQSYVNSLASIIQRLEEKMEMEQSAAPALEVASTPLTSMHQKIQDAAGSLFADGHHASAILEAFKIVNSEVKRLSRLKNKDGKKLMGEAFGGQDPVLRLNSLESQSDKDEQEGFTLLYMGAMQGIRNPKAHEFIVGPDAARTLDYLSFASLLMRRLDDAVSNAP